MGYYSSIWSHWLVLNSERSVFIPKQSVVWVVFSIYYILSNMYFLSLIDEKKTKSKEISNDILSRNRVTIRKLDKLIDNLVNKLNRFPAVIFRLLFYR